MERELSYKEKKRADREEKIVRTAQRIFADKGIEKTSMEEIAAAVPLSKATLYRHFTNKNALFFRVVRIELGVFRREMEEAISKQKDPVSRLKTYCKYRFKSLRGLINLYKVTDNRQISRHPYFLRQAARHRLTERQIVKGILVYGMQRGTFKRIHPPELAAETIINALNGLETAWAFSELTDQEISRRVDEMIYMLYKGIASRKSRQK